MGLEPNPKISLDIQNFHFVRYTTQGTAYLQTDNMYIRLETTGTSILQKKKETKKRIILRISILGSRSNLIFNVLLG
jgi:hypothetical protein